MKAIAFSPRIRIFSFLPLLLTSLTYVSAQTKNWTGTVNGAWGEENNWNPTGVPASNNTIVFGDESANTAQTISLGGNRTISSGGILQISSTGDRDYTITGDTLNFMQTSTTANAFEINSSTGSTTLTIDSNITISTDQTGTSNNTNLRFTGSGSRVINVNGNITGGTGERRKRMLMEAANTQLHLRGTNSGLHSFSITSGEVVTHSASAISGQLQGGGSNATLSLATNTTLSGSGAATFLSGNLHLRIREENPSSTDRILTLSNGRANSGGVNGSLTIVENINSTGRVIVELKTTHPTAANDLPINLGSNGVLRFAHSGNGTIIYGANTTSGIISGSGNVEIMGNGASTITSLRSANTYTGDTIVSSGTLILARSETYTGKLHFLIGADGVNNQITGGITKGNVTLDGAFTFDLSSAGSTVGNSWNIVDIANLDTVTFGETFSVDGFTQNGSLWTFGNYQFSQLSGELSVIPEPSSLLLLGFGGLALARRKRSR